MQQTYKLLNFEHGFRNPAEFRAGHFLFNISEQHCKNLEKVPRPERRRYSRNAQGIPIVERSVATGEGWVETIEVTGPSEIGSPLLLPGSRFLPVHELAFILTFLTGRWVEVNDHLIVKTPDGQISDSILPGGRIEPDLITLILSQLSMLKDRDLHNAFYHFVMSYSVQEFSSRVLYVFSALNACYDRIWAEKNNDPYPREMRTALLNSLGLAIENSGLDKDAREALNRSVKSSLFTIPAARKLLLFCEHVLNAKLDRPECLNRIRLLDIVRNSIFHRCALPKDDMSSENLRLSSISTVIGTNLLYVFFAQHVFNIVSRNIQALARDTREWIEEGRYRGQKIAEETFEEFLKREEASWTGSNN